MESITRICSSAQKGAGTVERRPSSQIAEKISTHFLHCFSIDTAFYHSCAIAFFSLGANELRGNT
jgi:hypothetical protein